MTWPTDPSLPSGLLYSGLRVIDAGSWLAGPASTTILADYGADVIKVESPFGDGYRALHRGPRAPRADYDYMWMADNRNKRGISLNLASEEGRAILLDLVRDCDVFVTNQPVRQRHRFGLTYEDLEPLNPRMIYASLTAYGEVGEEAEDEGFDAHAYWGRSGLMDGVRAPGAPPSWSHPGQGDHPTATALYASIVTGLFYRERTGRGTRVHTSLLASGLWANLCYAQASFAGADFSPYRSPPPVPLTRLVYEGADGRLLQIGMLRTDELVVRLLEALDLGHLLEDANYSTVEARLANSDGLAEQVASRFRTRPAAEWRSELRARGLPVNHIARTEDVARDPQFEAIGAVVPPADVAMPAALIVNHPVNVDAADRAGPTPAPVHGEHTREVLTQLGMSAASIDDYVARGVVAAAE